MKKKSQLNQSVYIVLKVCFIYKLIRNHLNLVFRRYQMTCNVCVYVIHGR